jgi:competence protein ComEA
VVTGKRAAKDQWATLVDQMITRGAQVEDEDIDTLVDYLAKNFGPSAPAPNSAANKDAENKDKHKDQESPRLLHVNTATAAQLAIGLGISPKESAALVAYREQNGNFKSWQDLTKVPGVDSSKFESKKDSLAY